MHPYEVGTNGIVFTISRLSGNGCSREWWESRIGRTLNSRKTGRVRIFQTEEKANAFAAKLNKTYK